MLCKLMLAIQCVVLTHVGEIACCVNSCKLDSVSCELFVS